MRKSNIIIAAFICAAISSCTQNGFKLNGELKNADGAKVILSSISLTGVEALDSAIVSDGKFSLKGRLPEASLCRLMVSPDAQGNIKAQGKMNEALIADFYLENAEVTFSADARTMQKYYWSADRQVEKPIVKGSEQQELKEALEAYRQEVFDSLSLIGGRISEEYYATDTPDPELGAELASIEMRLMDRYRDLTFDFVKTHPAATVSFDEISYVFGTGGVCPYTAERIAEFISVLRPEWEGTEKFAALEEAADAASRLSLGQPFVDAEFQTLSGEKIMLSSVVPKDRIVMLEFWASWCGPCRGEIPHLKQVRSEYPEFDIISISVDDREEDWKKAVEEERMDWTQLKDTGFSGGNAMQLYGVMGIPCCIILDEQGRFLKTDMRGPWLDAFLKSYYNR